MRVKRSAWVVMLAALAAPTLATPTAAQTNGFLLQCGSARSAGKACLNRGQAGVPSSLFRDPANIVQFERAALEVDLALIAPSISFANSMNVDAKGASHYYPVPTLAYIGPRVGPLSWGFGVEGMGGLGADFELDHAMLGSKLAYESMFAAVKAGPVVALSLSDALSVGGSVSYGYGMITDFRMPFALPASAAAGMGALAQLDPAHYPALFGSMTEMTVYGDTEGFSGSGFGADLGVTYRTDALTVSASFSPQMTLEMDGGDVTMDMTKQFEALFGALVQERMQYHGEDAMTAQGVVAQMLGAAGINLGLEPVSHHDGSTEMSIPLTAGIGLAFTPAPGWTIGVEGEFRQWSEAMASMPFTLAAGDNPNINLLVNGDPTNGGFSYPFPMEWEDTYAFKVGVEKWIGASAFRAGYHYGQNPVPETTVFSIFPAIATQAVSAGATLQLGPVPLDVSATYAFENTLHGSNPHHVGSEYAGSDIGLSGFGVNISFIKLF